MEEVKNVKVQGEHLVNDAAPEVQVEKLSKEQIAERQRAATEQSNYDPVQQEKRNNERMLAKDRAERSAVDPVIEAQVSAKMIADAEKELADKQAALDAVKAQAKRAQEAAVEAEKAAAVEAKETEKKLNEDIK